MDKIVMPSLGSRRFWVTSFIVSGMGALLVLKSFANDPCRNQVAQLAAASEELISQLGPINSANVHRITTVQDAISVQDEFRPGYREYQLTVRGDKAKAFVTMTTSLKACQPAMTSVELF
jgi:hypothetical protein